MENPSHSRQSNLLSKKTCNGTTPKSIYDDVFGGPPRFGAPTLSPRVEDYREIFGGFHASRASSIPVLDLPLVDEAAEVLFDVRSSGFDYGEVFGGLDDNDFAVYYDELMMQHSDGLGNDSSDEPWAPAEAENLSDESDHSANLLNEESFTTVDGNMEFNISYNKIGKKSNENLSNGITHIARLHSDSGYTFVVDKISSLPKTDYEYQHLQTSHDDHLNIDYSGEMLNGRHLREVLSYPANGTNNDVLIFGEDVGPQEEFFRNGSLPNEMFVTISDVSLRTQPSHLPPPTRPPPALDVLKGDSGKVTSNCKTVASEETAGDSSPPYFDLEVDASSSSAASAAAMKEAMEKAQAKLKSAKESIERKREGLQNRVKSGSKDRKDKEEKRTKIVNGSASRKDERGQGISQIEENGMEFSVLEEQKVKKTTQPISDSFEGKKHINGAAKSAEENHGTESSSSQGFDRIDVAGEWKEATQFFELVTNKSRKANDQENNENVLLHNSNFHERVKKEKKASVEALQQPQRNDKKVKAARADGELVDYEKKCEYSKEAFEWDRSTERSEVNIEKGNGKKVQVSQEVSKQGGNEKKSQVAQEVSKQGGHEKKFNVDWRPVETENQQTRPDDLHKHENYVEIQQRESKIAARQTMKHKEKGLWLKEDNKFMEDVKNFTLEKRDSEMRQRKDSMLEENDKKLNASLEQAENDRRLKKVVHEQEENENMHRKAYEIEENGKRLRKELRQEESERRLKEALEKEGNERLMKETREKEERLRRQREAVEREENEKRHREACEREENEKRRREAHEREENEKRCREAHEREENEKRRREAREREENEKRQSEAREREENEKRHKEAREREENEKRHRKAREREENEKRHREAGEREENEKRHREAREREENEKRHGEAREREENEKRRREAREREENEKRHREAREREENEKRHREAREREENEKRHREAREREENEKRVKEAVEKEDNERRVKDTVEKEERQRQTEAVESEENAKRGRKENEKRLKEAEKEENVIAAVEHEENERRRREAHEREENEKREAHEKEESDKRCKEALDKEEFEQEALEREVGSSLEEVYEQQENCMASRRAQEAEGSEVALMEDHEPEEIGTSSQATCEWEETEAKHIDVGESGRRKTLNKMGKDHNALNHACEPGDDKSLGATQLDGKIEGDNKKLELNEEIAIEETSKIMNELRNGEKKVASGTAQGNLERKSHFLMEDTTDIEQRNTGKIRRNFRADAGIGNQGKKFPYEKNDKGKDIEQTQVSLNPEISNVGFMSAKAVKESVDSARKMGGAEPAILEVKGSTQRTAQQVNASQSTERKVKNSYDTVSSEDKETERMKRERDLEMERLKMMEEEREREREREKDRMAVDKATLDTRERAYAEARERAERAAVERATAEARQRALNEARERLEKACAEAREKSLPEKASMEARLRAERAAVERATAEARERAFEKAMAERAASDARERVERSVSDKFSASSRSSGMRATSSSADLQDLQSQGSGSFCGSRYQYSSIYSERFEGVEGESAQRYKARLERHQRTAERAAKALAEKNMRDLFAQREQAERNRLAETLDADVKRWSSGKEGNLRALLSTLQYILGTDSGWQPIPLTEVITAAAVKKAYRKATLCVHPDKLQQRGASIQQKYVCEKVFDLLKEAWNKFNSEER